MNLKLTGKWDYSTQKLMEKERTDSEFRIEKTIIEDTSNLEFDLETEKVLKIIYQDFWDSVSDANCAWPQIKEANPDITKERYGEILALRWGPYKKEESARRILRERKTK